MIEVEKKLSLKRGDEEKLIAGATFLKEFEMHDVYYDDSQRSLTLKDTWLRNRNGLWELKVPLNASGSDTRIADQYRELTTETEIAAYLSLKPKLPLTDQLEQAGYKVIASIITKRRKYKKSQFIIDIDVMNFGYEIAEIELLVEKEEQMQEAIQKILAFAQSIGLTIAPIRGKVVEYIRRETPEHFSALIKAGVV